MRSTKGGCKSNGIESSILVVTTATGDHEYLLSAPKNNIHEKAKSSWIRSRIFRLVAVILACLASCWNFQKNGTGKVNHHEVHFNNTATSVHNNATTNETYAFHELLTIYNKRQATNATATTFGNNETSKHHNTSRQETDAFGATATDTDNRTTNFAEETVRKFVDQRVIFPENSKDRRPRNLRLAIVGDSVSRYSYLALTYYLRWNALLTDDDQPSLVREVDFNDYAYFFNFSSRAITGIRNDSNPGIAVNPYHSSIQSHEKATERCDCKRTPGRRYAQYFENHYYWDPVLNNFVVFLQKFGSIPAAGTWYPENIQATKLGLHTPDYPMNRGIKWRYDWPDLVRKHLAHLKPKLKYIIFNTGLWPHELNETSVQAAMVEAIQNSSIIGIYRRTIAAYDTYALSCNRDYEDQICSRLGGAKHCIDTNWTRAHMRNSSVYWNSKHMQPSGNNHLVRQYLEAIHSLEQEQAYDTATGMAAKL